eukprot:6195926-Pleurochrysis_carterae.AAC.1
MASQQVGQEAEPAVLAVLLDVSAGSWAKRDPDEFVQLLEHLLVFMHAFWLLDAANRLLVQCVTPKHVETVWPTAASGEAAAHIEPQSLRLALSAGISRMCERDAGLADGGAPSADAQAEGAGMTVPDAINGPLFAAALSLALCRIQRARRAHSRMQPRMLILSASEDDRTQHVALINGAFAAQKLQVRHGLAIGQAGRTLHSILDFSSITLGSVCFRLASSEIHVPIIHVSRLS